MYYIPFSIFSIVSLRIVLYVFYLLKSHHGVKRTLSFNAALKSNQNVIFGKGLYLAIVAAAVPGLVRRGLL